MSSKHTKYVDKRYNGKTESGKCDEVWRNTFRNLIYKVVADWGVEIFLHVAFVTASVFIKRQICFGLLRQVWQMTEALPTG